MSLAVHDSKYEHPSEHRIGIFVTDPEGLCLWVSGEFCSMVGLASTDLIGQFWFRVLDPMTRNHAIQSWEDEINRSRPFLLQATIGEKAGQSFSVAIRAELVPAQGNRPTHCVGTLIDSGALSALFEDSIRYERLREAMDKIDRTEKEAVSLYSTLNEVEANSHKLLDDLKVANQNNQQLQNRIEVLNKDISRLEGQLARTNSERYSLERQIQSLKDSHLLQLDEYQKRTDEARLNFFKQNEHLTKDLEALQISNSKLDSQIKDLQNTLATTLAVKKSENDAAKYTERELVARLHNMEQIIERERIGAQNKLDQKEKELETLKGELEAQLLKMLGEASDLLSSKKALADRVAALEHSLTEQATLHSKELGVQHSENKTEQTQNKKLLAIARQELDSAKQAKNELSEKYSALELKRDHDLATIEQQKRRLEELNSQNKSLDQKLKEANLSLDDSKLAIRRISAESMAEEDIMHKLNSDLATERANSAQLSEKLLGLEDLLRKVSFERSALEQQIAQAGKFEAPAIAAMAQLSKLISALFNEMFTLIPKIQLSPDQSQAASDLKSSAEIITRLMSACVRALGEEEAEKGIVSEALSIRRLISPVAAVFDFRAAQRDIEFKYSIDSSVPESGYGDPQATEQVYFFVLTALIRLLPAGATVLGNIKALESTTGSTQVQLIFTCTGFTDEAAKGRILSLINCPTATESNGLEFFVASRLLRKIFGHLDAKEESSGISIRAQLPISATKEGLAAISLEVIKPVNLSQTPQAQTKRLNALEEPSSPTSEPIPTVIAPAQSPSVYAPTRLKVLLAEDNRISQNIIIKLLSQLDCDVTIAINGRDAFEKLERHTYDLVLMDCQMPMVDGFQGTSLIRRHESDKNLPPITIYGLSAQIESSITEKCCEAGMDGCLSKPLQETRITEILNRLRH